MLLNGVPGLIAVITDNAFLNAIDWNFLKFHWNFDGLVQACSNSIANALE